LLEECSKARIINAEVGNEIARLELCCHSHLKEKMMRRRRRGGEGQREGERKRAEGRQKLGR